VARTRDLRDRGLRRAQFESALRSGALVRVRNGWIAVRDADPMLVLAAKQGVVLSCLTQAKRLGLWVHEQNPILHVAVTPGASGGHADGIRVHWAKPLIPRAPGILVDPIENVLAIVAECEPYEQALATWDSALNKGLVELEALENLPLRPQARRLLDEATPFADAGLETYLRPRLRWLRLPLRVQIWIAGHRVDALLGERLVLQTDGGHHVGAQRSEDIRHDAALRLMGYHVIRVSYSQMMSEWPMVQDLIMRAVAQGLHRASRRNRA
jgi:very-short-patch-repair endonuclease